MTTINELWEDIAKRVSQCHPQVFGWQADGSQGPGIHVQVEDENTLRGRIVQPPRHNILATKGDFTKVLPVWDALRIGAADVRGVDLEERKRGFVLGVLDWYSDLIAEEKRKDREKLKYLVKAERWLAEYHYQLEESRLVEVQRRAGTIVAAGGGTIAVALGLLSAGGALTTVLAENGVTALVGFSFGLGAVVCVALSLCSALTAIAGQRYWHPVDPRRLVERLWPKLAADDAEMEIDRTIAANLSDLVKKNSKQTEMRFAKVTWAVHMLIAAIILLLVFLACWVISVLA